MTKKDKNSLPPLENGLLTAMKAIDNQIAREMQRNPAQRDEYGVQKWEPFQRKIEQMTSFLLNCLGDTEVDLDSLLIMSQAMTKALAMAIEDLGIDGLGKIRTDYCVAAMESIERDALNALSRIGSGPELS